MRRRQPEVEKCLDSICSRRSYSQSRCLAGLFFLRAAYDTKAEELKKTVCDVETNIIASSIEKTIQCRLVDPNLLSNSVYAQAAFLCCGSDMLDKTKRLVRALRFRRPEHIRRNCRGQNDIRTLPDVSCPDSCPFRLQMRGHRLPRPAHQVRRRAACGRRAAVADLHLPTSVMTSYAGNC